MKIGILTFHRAHNYGAVLQCYALQNVLSHLGNETYIIDYRQPVIEKYITPCYLPWLFKKILKPWLLPQFIKKAKSIRRKESMFDSFRKRFLNLTCKCSENSIPKNFDVYVIGSDQVWSNICSEYYDKVYSGFFHRNLNSKLYGYAISTNLNYLQNLNTDTLKCICNNFDYLSFRETANYEYLKKFCTNNSGVHLDPTLLTDSSFWDPIINKNWNNKKYVLLYQVRPYEGSYDLLYKKASDFARLNNLELFDFTDMSYSVDDFVTAHKFAACIFTTSFHSTVFSIIFKRPFYSFCHGTISDNRYVNLLRELNLDNQLVNMHYIPDAIPHIDYLIVSARLNSLSIKSINYLSNF